MEYTVKPLGDIWKDGVFCVPKQLTEKHLKFASELQLRVLLLLLSNDGKGESEQLAKQLSSDTDSVGEALEYWVGEGVIVNAEASGEETVPTPAVKEVKPVLESLPVPSLTPRDIVAICAENDEIASLLRSAEQIMSGSLSNSMKSNIVNMVTYYGLSVPVVITLLDYYKSGRDRGKSITTRTLQNMAKEWAAEEINTLEAASLKLQELAGSEELWSDVISLCEFEYRKPTTAQLKMMARWRTDFDEEMIVFACNTMKKYNDEEKRSIKIVDNILKDWKRKGLKTPDDVKAQPEKGKKTGKTGKLKSKPSFDIDEIKKRAILNDNYDV